MRLYTFDIFDTLFVRSCNNPQMIFSILATKVLKEPSNTNIGEFVKNRIIAEQKALTAIVKKEVTLYDIYKECDFGKLCAYDNRYIMNLENEIEYEHLYPVKSMLLLIERLRKSDDLYKIGFISDMYLSKPFIQKLLHKHGFYKKGDILLVSCEENATKRSGDIYKVLKKNISIDFKNIKWHHWGDNNHSDCTNVIKNGGKCHYVNYKYTTMEKQLLKLSHPASRMLINKIVGCQKATRLVLGDDLLSQFQCDLIAPLFVPFCIDVLFHSIQQKTKTLFFFARDGLILYNISKKIVEKLGLDIKLKYLYISRTPIYLSTLTEYTCEEIMDIMPLDNHSRSIISILETFGIDNIVEKSPIYNEKNLSIEEKKTLLQNIFKQENFIQKLREKASSMRNALIGYLVQEGFADKDNEVAFVDLSGTRTSQKLLNVLLKRHNYKEIFGYYLSNTTNAVPVSESGQYYCAVPFDNEYLTFQKQMEIIESFYAANSQHKTVDYFFDEGKWRPIFEQGEINLDIKKMEESNLSACLTFANIYCADILDKTQNKIALSLAIQQNSNFFECPSTNYLKVFDKFVIVDSKSKRKEILGLMSLREIIQFVRYKKSPQNIAWPKGSIVRHLGCCGKTLIKLSKMNIKEYAYKMPYMLKKILVLVFCNNSPHSKHLC